MKSLSLKDCKMYIRGYLQKNYSDENLSQLLAHAQSGKLAYASCCCFIGIPTATHPLQEENAPLHDKWYAHHYFNALSLRGSYMAEEAFFYLAQGYNKLYLTADETRRLRIIPIVRAEIKMREVLKKDSESVEAEEIRA